MTLLSLLSLLAPAHAADCTETIETSDGTAALVTAIESAEDDDVICVGAGTFSFTAGQLPINFPNDTVTLRGEGIDTTILEVSTSATVEGGGTTWLLDVDGGNITIESLTLSGNDRRRLIAVEDNGDLTLDTVKIEKGRRGLEGAAIRLRADCTLTVRDSEFLNNTAVDSNSRGGHIYHYGGSGDIDIESSTFVGGNAKRGGAIGMDGGTLTITGSTFEANTTSTTGSGGIRTEWGGGAIMLHDVTASITDSTFRDNTSAYSGGAILGRGGSAVILTRTDFFDNTASGFGGSVFVDGSSLDAAQTRHWYGSAVGGGAVACYDGTTCEVADSGFWYNFSTATTNADGGGALFARDADDLIARRNLFCGNRLQNGTDSATRGGGAVVARNLDADLTNNVYMGNSTDSYGGALFFNVASSSTAIPTSEYETFVGNEARHACALYGRETSNHTTRNAVYQHNICTGTSEVIRGLNGSNRVRIDTARDYLNGETFRQNTSTSDIGSSITTGATGLPDFGEWATVFPLEAPTDPDAPFEDCRELYDIVIESGHPLFGAGTSGSTLGHTGGPDAGVIDGDSDGFSWLFDCDDADGEIGARGVVYADNDGDGFGAGAVLRAYDCPAAGEATNNLDCDDDDDQTFPGADEICDGVINDCDASELPSDEVDGDLDGYVTCTFDRDWLGDGGVTGGGDCDDSDDRAFPGVATAEAEGLRELCLRDADEDGWGDLSAVSPVTAGTDCDDTRSFVFPGATEVCDGIIDDCDLETLPADESDADGDLYVACTIVGSGWLGDSAIVDGDDCDDDDAATFPTAGFNEPDGGNLLCMRDFDEDGFGDLDDTGPFEPGTDCDDENASVFPGATEVCDGILNDCDAGPDLPAVESDADADGYVVCGWTAELWVGASSVIGGGDCDDMDARAFPGVAVEEAPGLRTQCLRDRDSDGWGDASADAPVTAGTDCADDDATIYPGAEEVCDGILTDCLLGELRTEEADNDGDLYVVCDYDAGTWRGDEAILGGLDCDDTNATVFPGADELCDGIINDCATEDLPDAESDLDEDGFVTCTIDGWVGAGSVVGGDDCDDADALAFPGALEICDGVLNDCDAGPDLPDAEADLDGDLFVACTIDPDFGWRGDAGTVGGQDCDDTDERTFPGVAINEGQDLVDLCLRDADADGFGDIAAVEPVIAGTDCDDDQARTFPGVAVNEAAGLAEQCLRDLDSDGYGDFFAAVPVVAGTDCDDDDGDVVPGTRGWDASCERVIEQDQSRELPTREVETPLTGCACSTSSPAGPGWLLLGLGALVGLVRRRRA